MARNNNSKRERSKPNGAQKSVKARAKARADKSPFLSIDEAALYLRVSARALEHFRGEGGGPAYRKHGGSIVYHIHDLDSWSSLRRFSSTSKKAEP
ncbi:MAG: helix-turn-helix domain-containing protein [Bryobacterales bacterium]